MKKESKKSDISVINPDAAGIDIGSTFHYVAVPQDRCEKPIRRFESFTSDLHDLCKWLKKCRIKTVAMESTGIYWVQLFMILEGYGFEVSLVNANHVKNVSGRKTDISDCQWIQQLHSYGLLSASFQPEGLTRSLRGYMRHRKNLTQNYSTHVLHMQKAFEQMNIKLHNVLADITGKSGQAMIQAILAGERDPKKLASLADEKVKSTEEEIIKSLEGIWQEEPLFELKQAYELYNFYKEKIRECDAQIEKTIQKFNPDVDSSQYNKAPRKVYNKNRLNFNGTLYLKDLMGVDITKIFGISEINALEIVSEVGLDMTKWPTDNHFTAWLNLAPNNQISGGKKLKKRNKKKKEPCLTAVFDGWLCSAKKQQLARNVPSKDQIEGGTFGGHKGNGQKNSSNILSHGKRSG
ncbi:MAG: IS110 family transposase [Candidatus Cyclobacteriaceae bacterium M3_2C_046]